MTQEVPVARQSPVQTFILKHQAKLFPVLDIALNGANYLFHVYVAWHLMPTDYGIVNALLSLSSLMLVTGISLQLYGAKFVAEGGEAATGALAAKVAQMRGVVLPITGAISVVYLAALAPLHYVTRAGYVPLLLLLVIFLLNAFLSVNRGVIQGTKQFIHLNLSFYVEVGVKIAVLFFVLRVFHNAESVLIAISVGMLASLVHSQIVTRRIIRTDGGKPARPVLVLGLHLEHLPKIVAIFVANFFTYFFTSLDMFLVNYYLPETSGYFAVVLKYTQIILFATLSVTTVFIPSLSAAKQNRREFLTLTMRLLAIALGIITVVVIAYVFLAAPTVDIFFGTQYAPAKQYILVDCIPYALLILNFVAINIHIIFDNRRYLAVLTVHAALLAILLIAFHDNLYQIILIESLVYGAMLVSQIALFRRDIAGASESTP